MYFVKMINNNVAFSQNEKGVDYIVVGKGIGFSRVKGELLPSELIDRSFISEVHNDFQDTLSVLSNIDSDIVDLTTQVSRYAEINLGVKFDNNHYLILADHLAYAIKRYHEEILYTPLNHWELNRLFPKEYRVARESLSIINEVMNVDLDSAEVAFLTNHFVNASNESAVMSDTIKMAKIIKSIIQLVQYDFNLQVDDNSFTYNKFVNHLRYFVLRQMNNNDRIENEIDDDIVLMFRKKYPEAFHMAEKIESFLQLKEGWVLSQDEKIYLTIHIRRISSE